MLITDTTHRLGINTMTHLFLQTFFCGDWYGKSIRDELEWVVKELTSEELIQYIDEHEEAKYKGVCIHFTFSKFGSSITAVCS